MICHSYKGFPLYPLFSSQTSQDRGNGQISWGERKQSHLVKCFPHTHCEKSVHSRPGLQGDAVLSVSPDASRESFECACCLSSDLLKSLRVEVDPVSTVVGKAAVTILL